MNQMNEYRLKEIEQEIKNAESNKKTGTVLMIISIFMLWPLLIVGAIVYSNANSKINRLNEEKKQIMFMEWKNGNNGQTQRSAENGTDEFVDYVKGDWK